MTRPPTARRGFVFLDAVGAILLLGAIATILAVVATRQARAAARLAEDRAAMRRAEAALLAMTEPATPAVDADLRVRRLDAPAPAGWSWVAVAAPSGTRAVELVGLARERSEAR